jgi:arylsulfatase
VEYGPAWAQVSSVPFRLFKGVVADGGIHLPLIVTGPGVKHQGDLNASVLHVMDITPTLLELAGIQPAPTEGVASIQGKSMVPLLAGKHKQIRTDSDWVGWELFGNRAIRQGAWKLLYLLPRAGGQRRLAVVQPQRRPGRTARPFHPAPRPASELAQALG